VTNLPPIYCKDDPRRQTVRSAKGRYGLDYVEVNSTDQKTLRATFLGQAPQGLKPGNFVVRGGERIRNIRVTGVTQTSNPADSGLDDTADITVDRAGDFSNYVLRAVATDAQGRSTDQPMHGFDPVFDSVLFQFKANCPSDLDCKTPAICPPVVRVEPDINYLAKDYESFRQLILDRLAQLVPDWQETHVPDIGIALVETLAYVGDQLSYYQDAVGTEAYLGTARQRISVRRHARLVDYLMHEGCNARAWVCVKTNTDVTGRDPATVYFITNFQNAPADHFALKETELERVPASTYKVFQPVLPPGATELNLYAAQSRISFYDWGDRNCCLPVGATSATLKDRWTPPPNVPAPAASSTNTPRPRDLQHLKVGDVLILEEVLGPKTGVPADADPCHRFAVVLTKVEFTADTLYVQDDPDGVPIVNIAWAKQDALPFALCISSTTQAPGCKYLTDVSIACGNVVLVDHGQTLPSETLCTVPTLETNATCECECRPAETTLVPGEIRPHLGKGPLTFAQPLAAGLPASQWLIQDLTACLPQITLKGTQTISGQPPMSITWTVRRDLLESEGADPDFVVEMDDFGIAHLRFGDGDCGKQPEAQTAFKATYRVGNGPDGNVGAGTIRYLVFRDTPINASISLCNPFPARGGTAPESVKQVKLVAPHVFRDRIERAITADDYATLAERNPDLQGAAGSLRWNGSWYDALVAVDPLGTEDASRQLLRQVDRELCQYRRVGHDVAVRPARYVSLDLAFCICVLPDYLRAHVETALLDAFGNRLLPGGQSGFFYPDNLMFGGGIYVSKLLATAQSVPGVESATVTRLERLYEGPNGEIASGVLPLQAFEIARLDNDPSFPEHGQISFDLRGGR